MLIFFVHHLGTPKNQYKILNNARSQCERATNYFRRVIKKRGKIICYYVCFNLKIIKFTLKFLVPKGTGTTFK
jgi:hypothetical protein